MKERPILFSRPMVLALLAGTKTMTRRLAKTPSGVEIDGHSSDGVVLASRADEPTGTRRIRCPYGSPGDRLWVRETWHPCDSGPDLFAADYPEGQEGKTFAGVRCWYPAIHMKHTSSRIDLEITAVRVERLQDITEEDAKAEGVAPFFDRFPSIGRDQRLTTGELAADAEHRAALAVLWDEINGDRATWASNPWVWAVGFKRIRP